MIAAVRASGLGVSSASIAQHSPGIRAGGQVGPGHLRIGHMPGPASPALRRGSAVRTATTPGRLPEASLASRDRRTASTARMCASRASAGRPGGEAQAGGAMPGRVSQHHAGPGPEPAGLRRTRRARQRATIARNRSSRTPNAAASRS